MRALLLATVLLLGAPVAQGAPIPIEALFQTPQLSGVQLSPDGTHLAALVVSGGRRVLTVIDLDRMQAHTLGGVHDSDVVDYTWVGNRRLLFSLGESNDASGVARYLAFGAVDIDGHDERKLLFGGGSVIARIGSDTVLTGWRNGVRRVDTRSGRESGVLRETPGVVVRWVVDFRDEVRAAVTYDRRSAVYALHYRDDAQAPWRELARFHAAEHGMIWPLAFDADNRELIVAANVSGDRMAVFRYDPANGALGEKLYESPAFDVDRAIVDRKSRRVLGVTTAGGASATTWFDPSWRALQAAIDQALPDLQNRLSWGSDNPDRVLVASYSDRQPAKYWLFERAQSRLTELPSSRSGIDPRSTVPVKRVSYRARDGLSIPAHLALPDGDAKPPLVVLIHGGPWAPGYGDAFSADMQFLASRGYAVLAPDFRGTTGYGRAFMEASYRQWGRAMQDDITDGVRWAIDEGYVDARRVCLMGGSYGGYAALMGIVREPHMFRCTVAYFAVTDPSLLFEPGWNAAARRDDVTDDLKRMIGDPEADPATFDAISPLKQAAAIKVPVLLAFGGADVRVPLVHGTRLRAALEAAGTHVDWVVYDDERHGFAKDRNRFDFYRRVETFLAEHLAR